jgi:APA family basic amino acid/polyamine antiporter
MMGLGSIVGTGVFVSIGVAAGVAGTSVVLAVVIASIVATLNGLNSAQLAAAHPVSGGTYEYGYRLLSPRWGFTAGWVFLLAKSASAATAALGFAGYTFVLFGGSASRPIPLALAAVVVLTVVVLAGIRRSNLVNIAVVSVTLVALASFVVAGAPHVDGDHLLPLIDAGSGPSGLLEATALMFVAYTGYGRIATLGEEVKRPERTIPRAVIATLIVAMVVYASVAVVAVGAAGADAVADATSRAAAPLEIVAQDFSAGMVSRIVAVGAITAMLGVLLNLILGLSRVALAMGRRGDLPPSVAQLDRRGKTPYVAVVLVGAVIAGLVLIGNVKTTWTFSAFTVLIYYAITNLAALRLPRAQRRFPRAVAWGGLFACAFLAWWVEPLIWLVGVALIAAGLAWHAVAGRILPGRPG